MIKVSDYIIKKLEQLKINHVFMLPGGGAMHLNDSLGKSKKLDYVVCLPKSWLHASCIFPFVWLQGFLSFV